jgi:MFS family permease
MRVTTTQLCPQEARARGDLRLIYAVLLFSVQVFTMLQSLTLPVLAQIAGDLDTDRATVTWIITAYLLSASIATPIMGRLGDAWGKNRVLTLSLALMCVGCVVSAVAPGVGWLIAGRAIQGMSGGILPVSFSIVRDEFPSYRVAFGVSVLSSSFAVGMGLGVVVAGPMYDALGFRWLFWTPAIASAACALVAARIVPPSPVRTGERISYGPAVVMAAWLVLALLAISQGPDWGWTSLRVIGCLVLAMVGFVAWVMIESRVRVPLIDMKLMRRRSVWTANLVAFLVGTSMYTNGVVVTQFAQSPGDGGFGFGLTAGQAGLLMLPSTCVMMLAGFLAARLGARWGTRTVILTGCLLSGGGLMLLALPWSAVAFYTALTVTGSGTAFALACLATTILASVPANQTGVATGMNANIRTIGGAVGTAVLSTILAAYATPFGGIEHAGYVAGFLAVGGAMAAAGLAGLLIPAPGDRRDQGRETDAAEVETAVPSAAAL